MVGNKIRQKRKQEHLTISQLAKMANISESYLSQLEREIIDPSVSVLRKIASILQVPVTTFFDEEVEEPILIKVDRRRNEVYENVKVSWISPYQEDVKIQMLQFSLQAHQIFSPKDFENDICILVTKGVIQVNDVILNEQDSIFIPKNKEYTLINPTDGEVCGIFNASRKEKTL